MKFCCDNCKAKYQIADEKVAGRTVRMKCRKCGLTIEIRSSAVDIAATLVFSANLLRAGGEAPPEAAGSATRGLAEGPTRASAEAPRPLASARTPTPRSAAREAGPSRTPGGLVPPALDAQGGPAVAETQAVGELASAAGDEWFVGVDGSVVGPIGINELRARAMSGAVQADSLVWREGFLEWVPLGAVPELRGSARPARPEPLPLSRRAGALIDRLGVKSSSPSRPASSGGQAGPFTPQNVAPAPQVNETLALGAGAMPLMVPGPVGQAGPAPSAGSFERAPASPPTFAPPPSPPPAAPATSFGAPFGGHGAVMPAAGGQMGAHGMGVPTPIFQQVVPFPQHPFGMAMQAAQPAFSAPLGFPTGPSGYARPVSTPPYRSKGGIPFAGWVVAAAALCLGASIGAKWLVAEKTVVQIGDGKSDAGGDESAANAANADNSAGAAAADTAGGAGGVAEGGAGGASAESAAGAAGASGAAGATGAESAGAGGAGDATAGDNAAGSSVASTKLAARPTHGHKKRKFHPPRNGDEGEEEDLPPSPDGRLRADQVQGVVANGRAALRRVCWEPALAAKGGGAASARLTVGLTIGPDGKVQEATTSGGEDFPALGGCVSGRIRSWLFPSSPATTQTTIPIYFKTE